MKRYKQQTPRKGKNPRRPQAANRSSRNRGSAREPERQIDGKYMDLPMKTIEERKAAQLAKWRKELGLDAED